MEDYKIADNPLDIFELVHHAGEIYLIPFYILNQYKLDNDNSNIDDSYME